MYRKNEIIRFSASERLHHWSVALCFVLAALSGLIFFHPAFYWLTGLFGSATWARILHPFIGVVMFVLFFFLFIRELKHNRVVAADREWMKHIGDVIQNKTENLPELGKFNLGQKYLTRMFALVILVLIISGLFIWQPWFAPTHSVEERRIAVLIHALAGWIGILCLIGHVYAAIWTKGSIRAMILGTVTKTWAKHHHAGWLKDMLKKVGI